MARNMGSIGRTAVSGPAKLFKEFMDFLVEGNIITLAIAFIMGTAFKAVVDSFVTNLISPIIGLAGKVNLDNLFVVMKGRTDCSSIADCASKQSVTLNYGAFLTSLIAFIIVSLVCFIMVKILIDFLMNAKKKAPTVGDCDYCSEEIKLTATICPHCQSTKPFSSKKTDSMHEIDMNE